MIRSSESPSISISLPSESLSYSSTWLESATDASVTCGILISLTKLNGTSATQILSKNVSLKPTFTNVTLSTYSHCGISANQTLNNSSIKPTHITLQSNSRLKSQKQKRLHFWIQLSSRKRPLKESDSYLVNTFIRLHFLITLTVTLMHYIQYCANG